MGGQYHEQILCSVLAMLVATFIVSLCGKLTKNMTFEKAMAYFALAACGVFAICAGVALAVFAVHATQPAPVVAPPTPVYVDKDGRVLQQQPLPYFVPNTNPANPPAQPVYPPYVQPRPKYPNGSLDTGSKDVGSKDIGAKGAKETAK